MTFEPLIIRDPVHGDIKIVDEVAVAIIATSDFQRLRRIYQMSGSALAFPGATHNRFSHSIGVYYLVNKILESSNFKRLKISPREKIILRIAGLLHDIGHGAFSHTFEQVRTIMPNVYRHEYYSAQIVLDNRTEINQILKTYGFKESEIIDIANIIEGKKTAPALSVLINSQIDADRMDYLKRDDLYSGTGYGNLDIDFLIRNMQFNLEEKVITFRSKAIFAIENYLIGRYHMYYQIYHHHISLGFNALFQAWFKRLYDLANKGYAFGSNWNNSVGPMLINQQGFDIIDYLQFDDYSLIALIRQLTTTSDPLLSKLSNCIMNRQVFRRVPIGISNESLIKKIVAKYGEEATKYLICKLELNECSLYNIHQQPIWIATTEGRKNLSECSNINQLQQPSFHWKKFNNYFIISDLLPKNRS